jgi:hypothetical protein
MQVMVNVISNAIKFSENNGSIEISIQRSGRNALILVRDFGKGIPPGHEEQVFAAFAQIDSSDRRSVNGSGLGMAVSKHIMHEHDGDISYESELGVGTVFKISLPLARFSDEVKPSADRETGCARRQCRSRPAPPTRLADAQPRAAATCTDERTGASSPVLFRLWSASRALRNLAPRARSGSPADMFLLHVELAQYAYRCHGKNKFRQFFRLCQGPVWRQLYNLGLHDDLGLPCTGSNHWHGCVWLGFGRRQIVFCRISLL